MAEVLTNFVSSPLDMAAGLDLAATVVTVVDGSAFPVAGNYRVQIEGELMLCTGRLSNDLTVTRAVEGTVASAHSPGVLVSTALTAGGLVQYVSEH
jgi:hypothetical protein